MTRAELLEHAYETGVLNPVDHAALLRDADRWAKQANIPTSCLYRSMKGTCTEDEVEFLLHLRTHAEQGTAGLVLVADWPAHPVMDRFSLFAAACLRNYIPARVMMLNDLLTEVRDEGEPVVQVLLVPDLTPGKGAVPPWQASLMTKLLYNRYAAGQPTLVYAQSMDAIRQIYGPLPTQLIEEHYVRVCE